MSDDTLKMSRVDLYDWVLSHKCCIYPLKEYKAKVILVKNPKNDMEAYINLPINNQKIRDYTVYKVCNNLGIPIPTCVSYMKEINDKIEDDLSD